MLLTLGACGDNLAAPRPDASLVPDATTWTTAPHAMPPIINSGGGPVMTAPVVVPIFFAGDDPVLQGETEKFLNQLAASPYWTTIAHEYGVGNLTIHPTIVPADAAPTSDGDIGAWLATMTDGTHDGWPLADASTVYAIYLPSGDVLTDNPGQCTSYGGYHSEAMSAGGGSNIIYAIMPRCSVQGNFLYDLTLVTSHELLEAATDPFPFSAPAFVDPDADHYIWGVTPGGELGDMCEYVRAANKATVGNYIVQRTWSNESAAAGHDPCVPLLATPYTGLAPVLDADVSLTRHGGAIPTKGVEIPLGMSKTIEVDLFSDASAPDWTVSAYDVASTFNDRAAELTFAWDKTSGHNGDKLQLTITRIKAASRSGGSEFVLFSGTIDNSVAQWWGVVTN